MGGTSILCDRFYYISHVNFPQNLCTIECLALLECIDPLLYKNSAAAGFQVLPVLSIEKILISICDLHTHIYVFS